jgi:hypothetical protein
MQDEGGLQVEQAGAMGGIDDPWAEMQREETNGSCI